MLFTSAAAWLRVKTVRSRRRKKWSDGNKFTLCLAHECVEGDPSQSVYQPSWAAVGSWPGFHWGVGAEYPSLHMHTHMHKHKCHPHHVHRHSWTRACIARASEAGRLRNQQTSFFFKNMWVVSQKEELACAVAKTDQKIHVDYWSWSTSSVLCSWILYSRGAFKKVRIY